MHRLAGDFLASKLHVNPQTPTSVDPNSRHQRVGARLVQVRFFLRFSLYLIFEGFLIWICRLLPECK
jgi:hypothetical protein